MRFISHFPALLLNYVLPVQCMGCKLVLAEQRLPICPVCLQGLEKVQHADVAAHVQAANHTKIPLHTVYAHWYFDPSGLVQKLHHHLKYGNKPMYGVTLGTIVGHGILTTICSTSMPHLVIPVPLHKQRLLDRGYNQSLMLAKGISEVLNVPTGEGVLWRKRSTKSQTSLNHDERSRNVDSAFGVNEVEHITDKHVLLIDDILTTGATVLSAAKSLFEAGAGTISIATLGFSRF